MATCDFSELSFVEYPALGSSLVFQTEVILFETTCRKPPPTGLFIRNIVCINVFEYFAAAAAELAFPFLCEIETEQLLRLDSPGVNCSDVFILLVVRTHGVYIFCLDAEHSYEVRQRLHELLPRLRISCEPVAVAASLKRLSSPDLERYHQFVIFEDECSLTEDKYNFFDWYE
ncbi:hypothetical protein ACTXT7_013931 [Hymenolepis weldensis]